MAKEKKAGYVNGITTPKGRIVYPYVDKLNDEGQFKSDKYEVTFFFSKDATLTVDGKTVNAADHIRSLALEAARQVIPDVELEHLDISLRDGDEKKQDMFNGAWVMNPKTKNTIEVFDGMRNKIDGGDVTHGCFGRLSVTAGFYKMAMEKKEADIYKKANVYVYEEDGNPYRLGVTFYLSRIQVTAPNDGSIQAQSSGGAYDFPEEEEDL